MCIVLEQPRISQNKTLMFSISGPNFFLRSWRLQRFISNSICPCPGFPQIEYRAQNLKVSKDQAWSYDQPKVQAWTLLRRTHQAVLLKYDHAWSSDYYFFNSGL